MIHNLIILLGVFGFVTIWTLVMVAVADHARS